MLEFFAYFLLAAGFCIINSAVAMSIYHWDNRRREMKFLRHLRIEHPGSVITLSAVESSDRAALNQIKEQLDTFSD